MLGTYHRLRVPVSASPREVIRAALRKVAPQARRSRPMREARHAFLREMLSHHADARRLARSWRL